LRGAASGPPPPPRNPCAGAPTRPRATGCPALRPLQPGVYGAPHSCLGMYLEMTQHASLLEPACTCCTVPLGRERGQAPHCAQPHVSHQRHWSPSVTVQAVTGRCMARRNTQPKHTLSPRSDGMPQPSHHSTPACTRSPTWYECVSHPADARHRTLGDAHILSEKSKIRHFVLTS
jgi:hypothetical protein